MTRILTLMENTNGTDDTVAEHGLSFLVERQGRSILFDTGKSGAFLENAKKLGADAGAVEAVVISHGHYDHAGGVRALYERTGFRGPLWTGNGFFDKKWSMDPEGPRYTGTDFDRAFIEAKGGTWKPVGPAREATLCREVIPGVFAVTGFPRVHACESANPRFVVDRGGERTQDDFSDEVCLAVLIDGGIAVLVGCAHPGLMNMLDAVKFTLEKPIRAVFGGSHLIEADEARIKESIEYLANSGCSVAALGHCTGPVGVEALSTRLPAYRPLFVGASFTL